MKWGRSERDGEIAQEANGAVLIDFTGCDLKDELDHIDLFGCNQPPIQIQEGKGSQVTSSLIAIRKRMIFHAAIKIGGGKNEDVRVAICSFVQRSCERRLQRVFILDACKSALF